MFHAGLHVRDKKAQTRIHDRPRGSSTYPGETHKRGTTCSRARGARRKERAPAGNPVLPGRGGKDAVVGRSLAPPCILSSQWERSLPDAPWDV